MTTFVQLSARLKNFLRGWLLVLGLKEGLVECATVCVKSVVILVSKSICKEKLRIVTFKPKTSVYLFVVQSYSSTYHEKIKCLKTKDFSSFKFKPFGILEASYNVYGNNKITCP